MKTCEYPNCQETKINEWGMCLLHEVNHGGIKGKFDLKRIQDGLKRMSDKAPVKTYRDKFENQVQQVLF